MHTKYYYFKKLTWPSKLHQCSPRVR